MPEELGEGYFRFKADDTQFKRRMRTAEAAAKQSSTRIASSFGQIKSVLSRLRLPAFLGGAGAGMVMRSAVKSAMDFQTAMAAVSTMVQDTNKWMGMFTTGVERMSVDLGKSAEDIASGLYDVLSAGVEPAKALNVLEVAVRAAKAGQTDVRTAADAVTTVLNAYKLSSDKAADAAGWLFSIVKKGKTTFAELAPTIGNVATTAASAGVSMKELGAMLAVLTASGIKTEEAVTAVQAVIASFLAPSKQAAEAARRLGFSLDTATLRAEGLYGVFKRIQGLSPEQIAKIFPNVRAIKGLLPALTEVEGKFSDAIGSMTQGADALGEAFTKMADTTAHAMDRAAQSIEQSKRRVGAALMPYVADIAQVVADVVNPSGTDVRQRGMGAGARRLEARSAELLERGASRQEWGRLAEETRAELSAVRRGGPSMAEDVTVHATTVRRLRQLLTNVQRRATSTTDDIIGDAIAAGEQADARRAREAAARLRAAYLRGGGGVLGGLSALQEAAGVEPAKPRERTPIEKGAFAVGRALGQTTNILGALTGGGPGALAALAGAGRGQRPIEVSFHDPGSFWRHMTQQLAASSEQKQIVVNTRETVKRLEKVGESVSTMAKDVAKELKSLIGMGAD